jgi:pimeloyl-ACP methyl ester carboxylesterase
MPMVDASGIRIHYDLTGDGPPVVLHGSVAGDMRLWRDAGYIDGLGGMSVVTVDPRGHGLSDRPHGLPAHRIGHYVDDVVQVLDALSVERCAFLGHGDGACIGLELAARRPDRIDRLVMIGAIEDPAQRPAVARALRVGGIGPVVRSLARAEDLELPSWLWMQLIESDLEMVCCQLEAWADWPGVWPLLPHIHVPTLLVVGEHEDPGGDAERAAATMPAGVAATVADAGHLGVLLQTDAVLRRAAPFLSEAAR